MRKKQRSAYLLESLEARLLFSADLAPLPVDGGTSGAEFESDLEISLQPDSVGVQEANENSQKRQEVIFVDSGVDDYQQLIDDIESQLEKGRQFDIVNLESDSDGIDQISAYLRQHERIDAVHVVSHGSEDAVKLGNVWLTPDKLDAYGDAIEGWQQALSSDADLLFYGCNLAAGDGGQDLVDSLTLLTGADVAASDDVTGNDKFGGDWVLEYKSGQIEASVPFSVDLQTNWSGLLNTFTVTTTADGGAGSLRQAIIDANTLGGSHTIILAADTYTLSITGAGDDTAATGDLDITADITITGVNATSTIIDASGFGATPDRVFHLIGPAANLTLTDLTVKGGSINDKGGGIYVEHQMGQLTAERVIVTGNIADDGAGIFNDGIMTLTDVVISNNGDTTTNEGGGIHNKETAILERVTISGNHADKGGGKGGGIHNDNTAWDLSLKNVTISGNTAADRGGGLNNENPVAIDNATFTLNTASNGSGIFNDGAASEIDIRNTIVAGNLTNPDVEGDFNSLGNNLIGDEGTASSGFTDGVGGDQVGTSGSPIDPLLDSLRDNGGFTKTHMPLGGSPVVDAGTAAGAPGTDQRGITRPLDGDGDTIDAVDIGAVEVVPDRLVHAADSGNDQETSAENRGSHKAVAMAANGNYVVVWSSDNEDGSGWGVFGQRFDASGTAVGSKFQVNDTFNDNQRWATVAMDAAGNFVVVWTSDNQDSNIQSVYARGFNVDATEAFAEFKVNTHDASNSDEQRNPSIAMAADGRFVVAWEGVGPGESHGIFYRRFNADGSPRDAADRPASNADRGTEITPAVAINDSGDFAITWEVGNHIYVRSFGDDGIPLWVEDWVDNLSLSATAPALAIDAIGRVTVVYQSDNLIQDGIWKKTYASDGTSGAPILVDQNPTEDSTNPSITMDSAGNYIIVYEGSGDGDGLGVFARKYDASGTALTDQFQINQTATGTQHMISVAMLDTDNFVVVWSGNGPDDGSGVYQRIYGTPSNNAPVIDGATFDVDENSTNGTAVGTVPVTDPDAGDTHVYTITAGNTGGAFAIDNSGNITVANSAALNFETTPVFTLTVQVQDQGGTGLTDTATVTVNLNDINDAPVINDSAFSVDENAANGTLVGTVAATDSGHAVNYTMLYWVDLKTDELRRINLNGTGNELLAIQADGTAASGMRNVAVDDVNGKVYWVNNNSDEIWCANLDGSSPERILSGIVWPMGIAVDAAGEKIYWFDNNSSELWWADLDGANPAALITAGINHPKALAIDASGGKLYWTDNGLKTIMRANLDGSNLETVVTGLDDPFGIALHTAAGKVYWAEPTLGEIQRADMAVGATAETVITGLSVPRAVTVDTINGKIYYVDAGVDRIERANLDGSAIEIVTATGDWPTALAIGPPVQNLTYAITGGNTNGAFTIDSVTGAITVANSTELDFETTSVFNLTVTVTDAGGLADSATITINLNDINEAPSAVALDNTTVAENDDGAIIGNLTTTDPDSGDSHTYTVDDARFEVVAGQLKLKAGQTLDFESEPSVNLNITSTDAGGLSFVQGFTVTVTNVNEAPSAVALDNTTVAENDDGAIIGNLTTTDPDSGDSHTYTVDDARFEVVAGQLKLKAGQTLDFESEPSVNLNITSTDAGGLSFVQGFTVTVTNVNDAPSAVALDNTTVAENDDGAIIGNLTTTDPDSGDSHTYTVDDARFEVVAGQLKLKAGQTLDFESEPSVNLNITSTDAGGLSFVQGFTVTVTNVNEAPSAVALDNTTVAENDDGAIIGNLTTTDPDSGDSHTYTVDDARFEVVAGQLKLKAGQTLDFESEPSVNLNITSTDAGGLSFVQGFTVTVTNVNEAPSAVVLDNTTVAENDDGAIIGNLTTTDPDSGDSHTYTVDDARFEVVAGQLKLKAGQTLDFESEPSVNLNITSTDAGGLSFVQGFTVTVTNVNDAGTVTIDNTTPAQGDTLTANVIDPDGVSGAITYQWFSDGVVIGGATGKTYTTTQTDVGAVMTVTAIYTDDQGTAESLTSAPTAPVTNVNDTPVAVNDNLTAIEDQSMTFTSITDLLANDSDIDGDTLTISSFSQPTNGVLVDNGDGTFTYTPAENFDNIDNFTYIVSDNQGGTAAGAAIIVVTPVGDTPQVSNVSTDAGVQSGLINIDRNANDGAEVTHFKISDITNGTLYLADGVTRIDNGDFISVGQGQAGLRFTPAANSTADGSFNVESSEDGVSVASQSGTATSIISILKTLPPPAETAPSLSPSVPEEVVSEEPAQEESEELEDVADETNIPAVADDMASVEAPQNAKAPGIKKASVVPGISVFKRADLNGNKDRTPGRNTLFAPQTLKKLVESENLGELKTALVKMNITTLPPDVYELVRGSLDAVQEEMGKEILIGKTVVGSAIATSVGLSAGYVVWMLKGGSLMASVLSSLPAWQLADPLAILVGTKGNEDEDDDTLETIIKDGSRRDEDKKGTASELNKRNKESTKR